MTSKLSSEFVGEVLDDRSLFRMKYIITNELKRFVYIEDQDLIDINIFISDDKITVNIKPGNNFIYALMNNIGQL